MRTPKLLLVAIAFSAGTVAAAESSFQPRAPQHPALYSFIDVFRLTVNGPIAGVPGSDLPQGAPIRVAARETSVEPRFAIGVTRKQPDKWLLLLAGLALAGWVAHRRLAHSI